MLLIDVLSMKFPEYYFSSNKIQVGARDSGELFISQWGIEEPLPTEEQIQEWLNDPILQKEFNDKQKAVEYALINKEILEELDKLDLKCIRAIRENDTVRLDKLNNDAIALRLQLKKV